MNAHKKHFAKLVLKEKYQNYDDSLLLLNLDSLETRRNDISLKFAQAGIKNNKLNDLLPTNNKKHKMETRAIEKYEVKFANNDRMKRIHSQCKQEQRKHMIPISYYSIGLF